MEDWSSDVCEGASIWRRLPEAEGRLRVSMLGQMRVSRCVLRGLSTAPSRLLLAAE